jgi:phage shock protein C
MGKRLYRSRTDRMLFGVCGGLGSYFEIDPVIVRIIFILLVAAGGTGILAYIIMAIVVPQEGSTSAEPKDTIKENVSEIRDKANEFRQEIRTTLGKEESKSRVNRADRNRFFVGIAIVIIGIIALLSSLNFFWWFNWAYLWPVIIIAVGLLIIMATRKR